MRLDSSAVVKYTGPLSALAISLIEKDSHVINRLVKHLLRMVFQTAELTCVQQEDSHCLSIPLANVAVSV